MSSASEQNPMNPQDPLHYAPRYLREKPETTRLSLVEETRDKPPAPERLIERLERIERPERVEHLERPVVAANTNLDARLENAVFESLRHSLDPHVMREPPDFTRERDRRSVVFKIAGRIAAATGVAAVVALFFVNIVPVSRQPDASSSFVAAVQSMKTTPPVTANTEVAPEIKEVKAEASDTKLDKADVKMAPALSQFQSLLAASEPAAAPKSEASDKPLLQQFMQWNQKQPDKN